MFGFTSQGGRHRGDTIDLRALNLMGSCVGRVADHGQKHDLATRFSKLTLDRSRPITEGLLPVLLPGLPTFGFISQDDRHRGNTKSPYSMPNHNHRRNWLQCYAK